MPGQRRYGTTKGDKLTGVRGGSSKASKGPSAEQPRVAPDARSHGGEDAGRERPASEREPLLLGSSDDGNGGRNLGDSTDVFAPGSSRRDNSKVLTTLLVLNYMIGSGILNSPQVFEGSGIGPATILYIVSAVAVWLGIVVLINASEISFPHGYSRTATFSDNAPNARTGTSSDNGPHELAEGRRGGGGGDAGRLDDIEFAHLAKETVGPLGPLAVDAAIVLCNFGDVCSYVILVGSLTGSLLLEWFGGTASDVWWASFSVVTPVMAVLFVFPPCLIRHFSNLRWLAVFSFCTICSVVALVVIGGPIYASEERAEPGHDSDLDASVVWWDWVGAVANLGSIVFALSCAPAVLHAYSSMTPRSTRAWRSVATSALGVGVCLCYSMGLAGYLSFRDSVDGDILLNFSGTIASVFKAAVVVHLILYIPSEVIVMRHSLYALRGKDVMVAKFGQVAWVTFALLALVVGAMIGLNTVGVAQGDMFGYILDITGGVAASATSFVLPGLIYLGATGDREGRGGWWPRFEGGGPGGWGSGGGGQGGRLRDVGFFRLACKGLVVFGVLVMVVVPIGVAIDIAGY